MRLSRSRRFPAGAIPAIVGDVGQAGRSLRRSPALAAVLLLTLALGAGLSIPLLSLADSGLRHPTLLDSPAGLDLPVRAAGVLGAGADPRGDGSTGPAVWGGSPSGAYAGPRTIADGQREGLSVLLWALGGAAGLALLVACANLTLLLLSRAVARRHETAMRAVLGASMRRLFVRFGAEASLLAVLGLGAGALLAIAGAGLLRESWPEGIHRWMGPVPGRVAAPVLAALAGCVLLGALAPLRLLRGGLSPAIAGAGRATPARGEGIARSRLGVQATAVSVTLLAGAALLMRGFAPAAAGGHPGLDPRDTLTLEWTAEAAALSEPDARASYLGEVLREVRAVPGVRAASLASQGAWMGLGSVDLVHALTGNPVRPGILRPTRYAAVSPGYFAALKIPVRRGREFTAEDRAGGHAVAVVSETFANRFFPGADAVGKQVQPGRLSLGGVWYTVVGVVGEVRPRGIGSTAQPEPVLYLSALQVPPRAVGVAVRTAAGDPLDLAAAVERAIRRVGPAPEIAPPDTLDRYLARFRAPLRWMAGVFGALALFSVMLASVGLSGVIAFNVARRTREIGVRAALGAAPRRLIALVMRQGLTVTARGIALGLAGALCLGRLLQFFFHGVDPLDPLVLGGVAALLMVVSLLASLVPARAASRVEPSLAMRAE